MPEISSETEQELLKYIDSLGLENPKAIVAIGDECLSVAQMREHVQKRTKIGLLLLETYKDDKEGDESDFQ